MTAEELFEILSAADSTMAVKEVPKGTKCNAWYLVAFCTWYLVANSHNVTCQAEGQKNHFWDDCGAWDIKQGRVAYRTFV